MTAHSVSKRLYSRLVPAIFWHELGEVPYDAHESFDQVCLSRTAHKGQPGLLVSREEIDQWMSAAGFKFVQEYPDLFPGTKWFLIYGKK